ncbi:MAG: type II and III secretion system protein [Gemmataceae bacterium]|nr:type II and III secretion system protein [Gemmataceae bacterium]
MNAVALVLGLVSAAGYLPPQQYHIALTVYQGDPLGSEADGTLRVVSQPQVVVTAGSFGMVRCGQDVPVPKPDGTVAADWAGVRLEVVPAAAPGGRVRVDLTAQVRELSPGLGIETAAGFVPGFTEHQLRAAWVAKPGEPLRRRIAARSAADQTWVELTVRPVR